MLCATDSEPGRTGRKLGRGGGERTVSGWQTNKEGISLPKVQ